MRAKLRSVSFPIQRTRVTRVTRDVFMGLVIAYLPYTDTILADILKSVIIFLS